ncbi:MAG: PspC domain-containing protein [Patescibacteria group bacterium]|jgi:phage shock protein C
MSTPQQPQPVRRLFRSETNRILGGVAGGLGEYVNIDPTIIRILFVLLAVSGGSGVLVYLILWILIPSEGNPGHAGAESTIKTNAKEVETRARELGADLARGTTSTEWERIAGAILIVLGLFILLGTFGILQLLTAKLWPLALIIIGVLILTKGGSK